MLGRAGQVAIDLTAFRAAIDEARILEQWRRGRPPPFEALEAPRLRRRLLIQALETRVIRDAVVARGIAADPARLDEMLRLAAVGHRLERPPSPEMQAAAQAITDVDARLAARFEAPAARVRRVARDVLESELLTTALLDAVPHATIEAAWRDAHTSVALDLILVSRVPTTREIQRAVESRQAEIKAFYQESRRLFVTPERRFIRRLTVPAARDAEPAMAEAARQKVEALRARVVAGEELEALVRAEGLPREARRGGREAVQREQLPAAFELEVGALSPVGRDQAGFWFYRVEGVGQAVERTLDDPRVQREIASTLLRKADELPEARRIAGEARRLLEAGPDGAALADWVKTNRLRRVRTPPFNPGGAKVVPELGLAPAVYDAAFELSPERPMGPIVSVRQHLVVMRLAERVDPPADGWPAARAQWVTDWRAKQSPTMVERWLSRSLAEEPLWTDDRQLASLPLDALRVTE